MDNFILIHSTGGSPDETFFPELKKELEKNGYKVIAPFMGSLEKQSLENWLEAFKPYEKYLNEDTVILGRSIGPAFILRVLEKTNRKIKAAFLIAGFCSDLGIKEFKKSTFSFVNKPFDWGKIRKNCSNFFIYNSDNDPYVPLEKGEELSRNLNTKLTVIKGAGHFWFKKREKEIVEIILKDLKKKTSPLPDSNQEPSDFD